jgi:hypothetical protein
MVGMHAPHQRLHIGAGGVFEAELGARRVGPGHVGAGDVQVIDTDAGGFDGQLNALVAAPANHARRQRRE